MLTSSSFTSCSPKINALASCELVVVIAGWQGGLWLLQWEEQGALGKESRFMSNVCFQFWKHISSWSLTCADGGHWDNGTNFFMVKFNVNTCLSSTSITSAPLRSQTPKKATCE